MKCQRSHVQKDTKENAFVYEAFKAIKLGLTNTPNHFKIIYGMVYY